MVTADVLIVIVHENVLRRQVSLAVYSSSSPAFHLLDVGLFV